MIFLQWLFILKDSAWFRSIYIVQKRNLAWSTYGSTRYPSDKAQWANDVSSYICVIKQYRWKLYLKKAWCEDWVMEHWKDSLQASHLHLQPDLRLICISMLYKKKVLLNFLLRIFGGSRSAKRHMNLIFISNFAVLQTSLFSHQLISFNMKIGGSYFRLSKKQVFMKRCFSWDE